MKYLFLSIILIFSSLFSSDVMPKEKLCNMIATQMTNYILEKDKKNYQYVFDIEKENCILKMNLIPLHNKISLFNKIMDIKVDKYSHPPIITPKQFERVLSANSAIKWSKAEDYGYKLFDTSPVSSFKDITRKSCDKNDVMSVMGIKIGCRYDYQKDIKIDKSQIKKIYETPDAIIIELNSSLLPYKYLFIHRILSTGIVSNISLYLNIDSKRNNLISMSECKQIQKTIIEKFNKQYKGQIKIFDIIPEYHKTSYNIKFENNDYSIYTTCDLYNGSMNKFEFKNKQLIELREKEKQELNTNIL